MNKNSIKVIEVLNPLDPSASEFSTIEYQQGKTLEDLYPSLLMKADFVFSVNGKIAEDKTLVYPQAGDCIVMCPVLAGGDGGGKNIFRMVAMLALAYFSGGIATGLYTAAGGTFVAANAGVMISMIAAGVMIVGGMLVNAMMPPPKVGGGASGNSGDDTPTYGVDGPKNVSAEGIVVPVVYGRHRYGGNLINAYVTNDNDSQFLHLLFNCGEGPIASIDEILINDTPAANFKDVQIETRLGTADQAPISFFHGQTVPMNVGQELTDAWIYRNTDMEVDQLRFDFVNPNGLYGMRNDKPDTFSLPVKVEVQYRPLNSGAAWLNMGNPTDVRDYVNETRWERFKEPNQVYGFGSEIGIGTHPDGVQYIPNGQERLVGDIYYGAPGTDLVNTIVGRVVPVATFATSYEWAANKRTAVRRSFATPPLAEGKYEVRVRREKTTAPAKQVYVDQVVWSDMSQIVSETVSYTHTALLGLRIRLTDQLTGLPTVTHMNGGKLINVWNASIGKWEYRPSSNPAWITMDAMTNARYGAGESVSRFDMTKWMDWAAHCDAAGLQYNGVFDTQSNIWDALGPVYRCGHAGRTNIGTRYSITIERPQTPRMMFSVANMISGTFKQSWMSAADRTNELEVSFLDKDDGYRQKTIRIIDEVAAAAGKVPRQSSVSFIGLTSMAEVWRDAGILLNHNRLLLQTVEWSSPLEAIACSVGDVVLVQHDMPKWSLAGRLEAGSTTNKLVLDRPVVMEPGLQYSALLHMSAIKRFQGSVLMVQGTGVFLTGYDGNPAIKRARVNGQDVPIESTIQQGNLYGVILSSVDGIGPGTVVELWDTDAIESRMVVNTATAPGQEFTSVTLVSPLNAAPEQYMQWMFGRTERVGKPFTIKSIAGTHEYRRDITAIEYNEAAFQATPAPVPPNYSDLERFVKHAVIRGVDEEVFLIGTTTKSRVTVEYEGIEQTYFTSSVYLTRNGGTEEKVGEDPRQVTVEASLGDELSFRVVARDAFGRSAPKSTAPTITHVAQGRTTLPGDATGLKAHVEADAWFAEWDAPTDPDVNATELRIGPTWETGRLLFRGSATSCRFAFLPAGTHELRVRHCIGATDGLYSGHDHVKTITVLAPLQPIIEGEIDGRSIGLSWQECVTTQPLSGYNIEVGPNSLELEGLGFTSGRQFQRMVPAGKRLYWVTAVDVAGNKGAGGYIELEVLPDIDDAIEEIEGRLDEAVADLLNMGSGLSQRILAEAAARGTAIDEIENLITEGDDQLAQQINLLTARAVGFVRANLLFNGGFEFLLDEWGVPVQGDWSVVNDEWGTHLHGTTAPAAGTIIHSRNIPAKPGLYYSLSGDSRLTSATGTANLLIQFHGASGLISTVAGTPKAPHDFDNSLERRNDFAVQGPAPAGTTFIRVGWQWTGAAAGATVGLRYVKAEQGSFPITPYTSEASNVGALAALRTERTTRADADSAEATLRNNLAIEVNGQIASIDEDLQLVGDAIEGIKARWGLKIVNGNKVAGIQLMNDGNEASFIVLADTFGFARQDQLGNIRYPFMVGSVGGVDSVGINGNLFVDGTIKTRALEAEAVTADKIKAKTITANEIKAGAITADLINVGTGRNLLPNASFSGNLDYWGTEGTLGATVTFGIDTAGADWRLPLYATAQIHQPTGDSAGWDVGDRYAGIFSSQIPVEAGKRYEASVYSGAHRCQVYGVIGFYDVGGTGLHYVAFEDSNEEGTPSGKGGGKSLASWKRIGGFGVAPANAAFARVILRKGPTKVGANPVNSWGMFTMAFFAEASSAQTVFSPWSPNGQGTKITANGISTPHLSALSANIGYVTAGQINLAGSDGAANYIRSNGKGYGDAEWGFILGRDANGTVFSDMKAGPCRFWMHSSGQMGWQSPGITMTNGGLTIDQLNVINTLNVAGGAVAWQEWTQGEMAVSLGISVPTGQVFRVLLSAIFRGATGQGAGNRGALMSCYITGGPEINVLVQSYAAGDNEGGTNYGAVRAPVASQSLLDLGAGYHVLGASMTNQGSGQTCHIVLTASIVKRPA